MGPERIAVPVARSLFLFLIWTIQLLKGVIKWRAGELVIKSFDSIPVQRRVNASARDALVIK